MKGGQSRWSVVSLGSCMAEGGACRLLMYVGDVCGVVVGVQRGLRI